MKKVLIPVFILITLYGQSQELRLSTAVGFATGITPQYKKLMLYTGSGITWEFKSHKKLYVNIGLVKGKCSFNGYDQTGNASFHERQLFLLGVNIRRYYLMKGESGGFLQLGLYPVCYVNDKTTIRALQEKLYDRDKVYNLGVGGSFGYRKMFSKSLGIEFYSQHFSDVLSLAKPDAKSFRSNRMMLGVNLVKKFIR